MAKKLLLLNVVLLALVLGLGWYLTTSWGSFVGSNQPEGMIANPDSATAADPFTDEIEDPEAERPLGDVALVADRNLFSPDRRPPDVGDSVDPLQPPPLKEPLLHSTQLLGGERRADITTFEGRGQGARLQVKVGDMIDQYQVSAITADSMTLQWNDHQIEILKSGGPAPGPPERVARNTGGVNIITIGSRGSAVETTSPTEVQEERQAGVEVVNAAPQTARGNVGARSGVQRNNRGDRSTPTAGRTNANRRPPPNQRPPGGAR